MVCGRYDEIVVIRVDRIVDVDPDDEPTETSSGDSRRSVRRVLGRDFSVKSQTNKLVRNRD